MTKIPIKLYYDFFDEYGYFPTKENIMIKRGIK